LPSLNSGVIIHILDIFTPSDYPLNWMVYNKLFWNEQYLLEAFLTHKEKFKILLVFNYLGNKYPKELQSIASKLKEKFNNKPVGKSIGSF